MVRDLEGSYILDPRRLERCFQIISDDASTSCADGPEYMDSVGGKAVEEYAQEFIEVWEAMQFQHPPQEDELDFNQDDSDASDTSSLCSEFSDYPPRNDALMPRREPLDSDEESGFWEFSEELLSAQANADSNTILAAPVPVRVLAAPTWCSSIAIIAIRRSRL